MLMSHGTLRCCLCLRYVRVTPIRPGQPYVQYDVIQAEGLGNLVVSGCGRLCHL